MAIDLGMSKDSTNKCSLPASNDKGQKASYIKTECAYMKSFCVCLGIPAPSSSLKCLDTNARSMRIKQEALEICMRSQIHDLIMIMKTRWDSCITECCHGWLTFLGKSCQQGNAAELLFMWEQPECIKLHLRVNDDPEESLWVRIKGESVIPWKQDMCNILSLWGSIWKWKDCRRVY